MMKYISSYLLCFIVVMAQGLRAEESTETHPVVLEDGVAMGEFTHDYEAALAYAEENELPVMLVFTGSDWCGWCKIMDKNVFTKPEWRDYAEETIVQVWLDYPRNKELVPEK